MWKRGSTRDSFLNNWNGIGFVREFLPITSLIVFETSLGVLEFSNSWVL